MQMMNHRGDIMLKRKQPIIAFAILIVILVLELLPYGIILEFAHMSPDFTVSYYEQHFSYFDLIVYGYGNVGALFTAIQTCVLLVISAIYCFVKNSKMKMAINILSLVAFLTSLSPLLVDCYTILGGIISLLLLLFIISLKKVANEKI